MNADYLVDLLTLNPTSDDVFSAPAAAERHVRAFGGRTLAQSVVAVGKTVEPTRALHSLHAYFMRPGDSSSKMECRVQRTRDGRSFSSRRVEAYQKDKLIFEMMASFHTGERGPSHQDVMPTVIHPDDLLPFGERFAGRSGEDDMARWFFRAGPFDIRYVHTSPFEAPRSEHDARQQLWFRARSLPDDALLHAAALAYASDMTILDAVLLRHQMQWTDRAMLGATLDHAIWFHRPVDFNQWLLFDQRSAVAHDGRALAEAKVWQLDGALVATIAQEALMRPMSTTTDIP